MNSRSPLVSSCEVNVSEVFPMNVPAGCDRSPLACRPSSSTVPSWRLPSAEYCRRSHAPGTRSRLRTIQTKYVCTYVAGTPLSVRRTTAAYSYDVPAVNKNEK